MMPSPKTNSSINAAASRLRTVVGNSDIGAFLGGETELQELLGVSRTTLRQVARLLEREGVLKVKRGINGGYFASRPTFSSIEDVLTAHLEVLDVSIDELLAIASITWSESVRRAASLKTDASRALAKKLAKKVKAVKPEISNRQLIDVEQSIRSAVFELIETPYMQLIFQVNIRFARAKFEGPGQIPEATDHQTEFIADWRSSKQLELEAIALGDEELAILASQRTREVWTQMMRAFSISQS